MQYFGADGLGSVRQLYNSSGQIVANHRYDPFGNTISQSGVGTSSYGFTGEWTDATGLEYLRARYYAPWQGRFVTRDEWPGEVQQPGTLNRWVYGTNNPTNLTDSSGTTPRMSGVCPEPAVDNVDPKEPEYYTRGVVTYVYCGQFTLSAYQFISNEAMYDETPSATDKSTRDTKGNPFTISSKFMADVINNGTGRSSRVCAEKQGYFHVTAFDSRESPRSFTLECGKGKEFDPNMAAFKVAAADYRQLPSLAMLYIPYLCVPGKACLGKHEPGLPDVVVADTGGEIAGYRLDIFTGQGPGIRSNENNNPSSLWNWANRHMGTSERYKPKDFRGPTAVYQIVVATINVVFPSLRQAMACAWGEW